MLSLHSFGKSEKKEPDAGSNAATETPPPVQSPMGGWTIFAGTGDGLFSVDTSGRNTPLWSGGSVRKILRAENSAGEFWAILGSEGILISSDMQRWEERNQGLPIKTIKIFQGGRKSFLPMVQEIKDLELNPANTDIMVCATKDHVYLSRDQGRSWTNLGAPPYRTNGIKAVASAYMPGNSGSELTVFLSHSTYGIFYMHPDRGNAQWIELARGLETLETTGNPDEVADIAVTLNPSSGTEIYASQTFRRRIYKLDWPRKTFNRIWTDDSPFGTIDSLNAGNVGLDFLYEGTIASIDYSGSAMRKRQDILTAVQAVTAHNRTNCVAMRETRGDNPQWILLSELWLLDEPEPNADAKIAAPTQNINAARRLLPAQAQNREGLYLPVNHAMESRSLRPYLDVIDRAGLNMVVIDMKDDYGRLRFTPNNPAISAKGRVFRPLDIEALLADMKSRGIFTAARVVVFKDPELAAKENGRFAVWDSRNSKPWAGYYDVRRRKSDISNEDRNNRLIQFFPANDPDYEIVRTFYDEKWVDPYSEEVWEYIAATAAELHERGFDEIQFDYIRFPTDGENLGDARFRWQDSGMDRESAIFSFLRHVRERVKAPISIDIYGANGWYRTGARTGQEVELLAPWVDVISPMYYPSHFEQHFLAHDPPELRPWRIYYLGTLRTARIARGQAIIRPYAQAFFLNVAYDRKHYNADYVLRQLEGVRAAGNGGLTYWNNSGRYDDIPDRLP
ncbi:MAG: putative glycoside hydrolase [Treponema sp.]|nr:putative glycoside hydrolase [Treponema sp.]